MAFGAGREPSATWRQKRARQTGVEPCDDLQEPSGRVASNADLTMSSSAPLQCNRFNWRRITAFTVLYCSESRGLAHKTRGCSLFMTPEYMLDSRRIAIFAPSFTKSKNDFELIREVKSKRRQSQFQRDWRLRKTREMSVMWQKVNYTVLSEKTTK